MRLLRRLSLVALTLLILGGCSSQGLYSVSLPGGAGRGGYQVTIEFSNVLDLVPQAAVKVNDVTMGSVRSIKLTGWHATVVVQVDRDVKLPANAVASIRQTSLLGEKFVSLSKPTEQPPRGRLTDGATIPLAHTTRNVEVEELLGALSLLLNGGGIQQLKTINTEVNNIFQGREGDTRDALKQIDTFVSGLNDQKKDIVRAIDALDRFSSKVAKQKVTVAKAVDALDPALKVLDSEREDLVTMLKALNKLGKVGTRVVNETQDDLLANLRSLQPILTELVKSGDNLPKSLDFLLTYPFPPNTTSAIVGDYVNLHITVDLDLGDVLSNLFGGTPTETSDTSQSSSASSSSSSASQSTGSASDSGTAKATDDQGNELPAGEANPRQGGLLDLLQGGLAQ